MKTYITNNTNEYIKANSFEEAQSKTDDIVIGELLETYNAKPFFEVCLN